MKLDFPFSAIVGQEQLKQALLACAINPSIGGLLVRGDKGSAKSTAVRALANVQPMLYKNVGCSYNCLPDQPAASCKVCSNPSFAIDVQPYPVPFVNLPLGTTEDRVIGALDFEEALKQGKRAIQPGLLASAHRGILYIDEVNLLADHLVDILLDVACSGVNSIEREGITLSHASRFTLVGTMNIEEGDLRPQLLDRFGLMIDVIAPSEPAVRAEVVRRRLQFESNPIDFIQQWSSAEKQLTEVIVQASALLPSVEMTEQQSLFISSLCSQLQVKSLRADIVIHKASLTFAAMSGRKKVQADDIKLAAELALAHRSRSKPNEQSHLPQERLDEFMKQCPEQVASDTNPCDSSPESENSNSNNESAPEHEQEGAIDDGGKNSSGADRNFLPRSVPAVTALSTSASISAQGAGRRHINRQAERGVYNRASASRQTNSVAIDATLVHSLVRNGGDLNVQAADLHFKQRTDRVGNLITFIVDASGSMAAKKRMEAVKETVLGLLQDAYEKRDQVAVISFRGDKAELLLEPTRSTADAQQALTELPTGGRTPLADALQLASTCLLSRKADSLKPLLIVLTDGKANVALTPDGDAFVDALCWAENIAAQAVPTLVLDTETGYVRLGRARQLAKALNGEYMLLNDLSSGALTLTIRTKLGAR
ncbi:putative cobaltochelatase [soil metagenome]